MSEFNYPLWLNETFLEVLKKSLRVASEYEVLEDNAIYITFRVNHKGVQLSEAMRKRFPQDIMIVIENEYWNLEVNKDSFSIDLSFNGILETVIVPYKAIMSFSDPEYKVGYEFIDEELFAISDDEDENYDDENLDLDEDEISKTLTDILSKESPFGKNDQDQDQDQSGRDRDQADNKPKKKAKIVQINKK